MWLERQVNYGIDTIEKVRIFRSIRIDEIGYLNTFDFIAVTVGVRNVGKNHVEMIPHSR